MAHYLIVGASAGAVGAVEGIRMVDPKGEIIVVSEETLSPYSRPSIGAYLDGRLDESFLCFGSSDFWERNDVQTLLGRRAVALNLQDKNVQFDNGQTLAFEKLLLATGARPIIPKIGGIERDGFDTFTNLSDVYRIKMRLQEISRAVIIGGGSIGVAAAEALVNMSVGVTIVELREWLLNQVLDHEAERILESAMRRSGVGVVTGQSVKEVIGKGGNDSKVGGVILSGGERLPCDLVVSSIGVIPRTELAIQAGLKVSRGILVNRFMESSVPGVYACGDVAEAYEYLNGISQVIALWPLARLGGKVAGLNMAGKRMEYPGGVSMSALRYFDVPIISVGVGTQENMSGCEALIAARKGYYRKVVLRNDEVVGFTLVGDVGSAGLLNNLMLTKTKVSRFRDRLLEEDYSFAHLPEALRRRTLMEAWS